jgi:hypothetical protein
MEGAPGTYSVKSWVGPRTRLAHGAEEMMMMMMMMMMTKIHSFIFHQKWYIHIVIVFEI